MVEYGKCEKCGGELRRDGIPCPDGREGCAVFHFEEYCPTCIKWDNADYYSLSDQDEHLRFEDVEELLQDYIDQNDRPEWPVTVYAWMRNDPPDPKQQVWMVDSLLEQVQEWWSDEWGDPDGNYVKGADSAFRRKVTEALRDWVESHDVWCCSVVGMRECVKEEKSG